MLELYGRGYADSELQLDESVMQGFYPRPSFLGREITRSLSRREDEPFPGSISSSAVDVC